MKGVRNEKMARIKNARIIRWLKGKCGRVLLVILALLVWLPVLILLICSFYGEQEIIDCFGGVLLSNGNTAKLHALPSYPTLKGYVELLLDSLGFFVMFWNSCKQVFPILIGQVLIGVPAAWAFAHFVFPGKKILFHLYMLLMILPFQVTMVSSYLVLSKMNLLDTHGAIILPGIFATFSVFIITKTFREIPKPLLEAAAIDGAGEFRIFRYVAVPLARPGILSAVILSFLEYWNAIEQPMTFLETKSKWPLSLYLPNITVDKMGVSFCASVIMMLPAVLLFLWGQSYLEQGIAASGLKE